MPCLGQKIFSFTNQYQSNTQSGFEQHSDTIQWNGYFIRYLFKGNSFCTMLANDLKNSTLPQHACGLKNNRCKSNTQGFFPGFECGFCIMGKKIIHYNSRI